MGSSRAVTNDIHSIAQPVDSANELSSLRELLTGPIRVQHDALDARLSIIQEHVQHLDTRTADFSELLAPSIVKLHAHNRNLNSELEPEITAGLYECFNKQPERMAEVLYPILGPAVRKLVASLFQASPGELGKAYRLEQLFLIHKETSVVLSHSVLCDDAVRDADLVSGMLDAIRSFVQEAFALSEFDGMNSIKLGELTILVEWGPKAILAVVVRGMPDQALQDHYAEVLRIVHKQYAMSLDQFKGDAQEFQTLDMTCIETDIAQEDPQTKSKPPKYTLTHVAILAIVFMAFGANLVSAKRSWKNMLMVFAAEPGIVVISEEHGLFQSSMSVLRDPLAASEASLLDRANVDINDVSIQWYQFHSEDDVVRHRREVISASQTNAMPLGANP